MLTLLLFACTTEPAPEPVPELPPAPVADPVAAEMLPKVKGLFEPLPARMDKGEAPTAAQIDLGRQLYYETRLSKNQDISCNSCHMLDAYGVDNEPTSPGHKDVRGGRNSPTSYNAALHLAQFWDGRAADVEAQAKGPVLNPIEMAMPDETTVVAVIKSIPDYGPAFEAAYPGQEISYDNMANAIGAFERGLVTPAPWDAYLAGDATALDAGQAKGLQTFMEVGCQGCHSGVAVGGSQYRKMGERQAYETEDKGLGALKEDPAQDFIFKVPSLRNITETGPYLHDGSLTSLEETVQIMGKHQLDMELSDSQVAEITTFLGALKGTPDAAYIAKPTAFESGPETPAADPS